MCNRTITDYLKKIAQWIKDLAPSGIAYLLLVGTLAGYATVQVWTFVPAYTEPDPDGYIWMAKHFASFELPITEQPDNFVFQSHVWVENEEGLVTAKFAPGYPVLLAVGYIFGGDVGMFYVSPILGGLALLGAFFLFRLWMPLMPSVLAVLTLAATRMYLFYAGYLLTHIPNTCFVVWGAYFLWKWYREPKVYWAIPAGLILGFAPTIRHTTALMSLVVAVAFISRQIQDWREGSFHPRATLCLVSAGLFFPVLFMAYNRVVFGGMLTTGYYLSNEQSAFTWSQFVENYDLLGRGLYGNVVPVVLPVAVVGLLAVDDWTERLMRLLWAVPVYIVYSAYYYAQKGLVYYRFMIVIMPVLVGSAYALIGRMPKKSERWLGAITLCVLALVVRSGSIERAIEGRRGRNGRERLAKICREVTSKVDNDAVIFTRTPFTYHLGVRAGFRLYDLAAFSPRRKRAFRGNDRQKPRRQPARTERFRKFYEDAGYEQLRNRLQEIVSAYGEQGRQVVFLSSERRSQRYARALGDAMTLKDLGELKGARRDRRIYEVQPAEKKDGDSEDEKKSD